MHLAGNIEAYDFNGEGDVVVDGTAALFEIDGSGTPATLLLNTLALSTSEGDLTAAGDVNLDPVGWSLDVRAENLDPGQRFSDWPGTLQGQTLFQGRTDPALEWSASDVELSGELRDLPVSATGSVSSVADLWQLDDIRVQSGSNVVTADGTVGDTLSVSVLADAPETAALWPELSGAVQLEATIGGTFSALSVDGSLQGSDLHWREYGIEQISITAVAAPEDAAPLNIVLEGQGIEWNNLSARSIEATATGVNAAHELELDLISEQWAGRLLANGGLTPSGWVGTVDALALDQDALGEWLLTESMAVGVETGTVSVADFCVIQNLASLCGAASLSGASSDRIALNAANFDLRALQPLLPGTLSIEGVYDAELSLTGPMTLPNGTLSITGGPTRAGFQENQNTSREARFDELKLDAVIAGDSLALTGSVDGRETGSLSLAADLNDIRTDDPAVHAALTASWSDIGFVSVLSPDVSDVSGAVSLDVTIDGTLKSPEVQGQARMSDGAVSVPDWGLDVREIAASANNTDLQTIEFTATGRAGEGQATLNGTTTLNPTAGWATILSLRGEALEVVRLAEAEVDLSPELEIRVELPDVQVTGTVHVPRAQLSLSELPEQAVSPSTDVVIHGLEATEEFRPIRTLADLELTLGDDVTYSGGGLTTFVSGNMDLDYESGSAAVATGIVELAGDYELSGQSLTLERGRLLFAGALDNPGLDVRAVRQIESRVAPSVPGTPSSDRQTLPSANTTLGTTFAQAGEIRAGVELTGTLQAPQTRLFSEPTMSEADVLSYLLFGRPLTGTGGAEAATLESTAISMGLRRAVPVIQTMGESVGLDELTLHSTNADAGELMAGKFLSPRLYVRYTYGLFNRVGGLMLHYRLTDRFSLETRSGDEESMDILYVVEKD
jgi:translocation and assembly module TamB